MAANRAPTEQELLHLLKSMEQEGIVDHRLELNYSMKDISGPFFFSDLIPTYCDEGRITLREMNSILEQPIIDFDQLEQLCFKIKGGTSCLGASRLARACGEFRQAAESKSKNECIRLFKVMQDEFYILQDKMDKLIELEDKIVSGQSSRQ